MRHSENKLYKIKFENEIMKENMIQLTIICLLTDRLFIPPFFLPKDKEKKKNSWVNMD